MVSQFYKTKRFSVFMLLKTDSVEFRPESGCSGILLEMFELEKPRLSEFHKKIDRGKHALYTEHLSGLRCRSCNHRDRIYNIMGNQNYWRRHGANLKLQFRYFCKFRCGIAEFYVFLRGFTFFKLPLMPPSILLTASFSSVKGNKYSKIHNVFQWTIFCRWKVW